ncbi:MAG: MaoC family dehydratase [Clostridia bacterium]|nr:MaoC family dehydratase [Clostridia bacterium]
MDQMHEAFGNYYEDFEPGRIFYHYPGRTITQTDNVWFTLLTMNTHPLHFNLDYCSRTEFGKPLVNSTLTLAMVTGMSVRDISQNAIANLSFDEVLIPKPTFEGDTLYAQTEVIERRESKSRPECGIIKVLTLGLNQNKEVVMTFKRNILVKKRTYDKEQ